MIRLTAPSDAALARAAATAAETTPTIPSADAPAADSLRWFDYQQTVGHGPLSFEFAKNKMRRWQMHSDAGVHVKPVPIAVGNDAVMWTRTLGLTLVFACRITDIVDDASNFGFTYATLPDHPAEGFERFRLELINDVVQLHIDGASRPGLWLTRASGPIGRRLQKQATERYITCMRAAVRADVLGRDISGG